MKKAYDRIKKHYGEKFAKLCRSSFPELMEDDNFLPDLIEKNFAPSRFLYEDLALAEKEYDFKNYIYSKLEQKDIATDIDETPDVLMARAGYKLFKCETNADIHGFKHYWRSDEELCTFRDLDRINTHIIFFAVKEGAEDLKREDFTKPRRQDDYGTSVISIQFSKGAFSAVSIKNRYNHTVKDPDATFSNDLDNIYPGLTDSFAKYQGINFINKHQGFELPGYVMANDGRYYKYNYEIDNVYYCPNNVIINNGRPIHYDKSRYEIIDYFVLDKVNKAIMLPSEDNKDFLIELHDDAFLDAFYEKSDRRKRDESKIQNIDIKNIDNDERLIKITNNDGTDCEIIINKYNQIVEYKNNYLESIGDSFLSHNETLRKLELQQVSSIGDNCLKYNYDLTHLDLLRVQTIGSEFLYNNRALTELNLPRLRESGRQMLRVNMLINTLYAPKLTKLGDSSFKYNNSLTKLSLPSLTDFGVHSFYNNNSILEVDLPSVKTLPPEFLEWNRVLEKINIPNCLVISSDFLRVNKDALKEINAPKLAIVMDNFLQANDSLTEISLPNLGEVWKDFLRHNNSIEKADLPNLTKVDEGFLENNTVIKELNMPNDSIPEYLLDVLEANSGQTV